MLLRRPILILISLIAGAVSGAPSGFAGWEVPAPRMQVEGEHLGRDAILARIDSLESVVDGFEGTDRAAIQWRLAQLYISLDMPKHRRYALDLLDEAAELDPADPRPHLLWARLAQRMHYDSAVRERLGAAIESNPGEVEPLIVLGQAELRLGLQQLGEERLRSARRAWRAAVDVDSTRPEVWHGMAVSALALGEYRAARRAAHSLARMRPATGLPISAAALQRLGDSASAAARFDEALGSMSASERAVFLEGRGFLDGDDLATIASLSIPRAEAFAILRARGEDPQPGDEIDWDLVLEDPATRSRVLAEWWTGFDDRPAQDYNTGELEYWTRLVEADVLFGRPADSVRGWATAPGELWVRWGRPTSTWYDPGGPGATSRIDALAAAGVRFPAETVLPPNAPAIWAWTYRGPGTWISFLFTDASRTKSWSTAESSRRDLAALNARAPIRIARPAAEDPYDVAVSAVAYPRPGQDALVETFVGFEPTAHLRELASAGEFDRLMFADRDTIAIVDWSVSDATGRRIDAVRRVVGPSDRRSVALAALQRTVARTATDPYLVAIGARLRSGRYRIGVEVYDPVSGARSARDLRFTVSEPEPGDLLEMSGLQLAAAFVPWRPGAEVPPDFVKYATAVVPLPDHQVPRGSDALGVYFEMRNVARGADRRSSFDVRYAVYRSSHEVRDLAFQDRPDLEGLELVAPATLNYLEESTGVSPEGLVVKGTELDVGGLDAGDYVLVVSIHDRIAGFTVSRAATFRVSSP